LWDHRRGFFIGDFERRVRFYQVTFFIGDSGTYIKEGCGDGGSVRGTSKGAPLLGNLKDM
jgi:hypothetical protein